jgi:hypothetical protein
VVALAPAFAAAQQAEPPVYTFVAEWNVPRANWDDFMANFEKITKPVLLKHSTDGTLVGWGVFSSVVHEQGAMTHGTWWQATSLAAIERVRNELVKVSAANTAMGASTAHRDYLLRSILRGTRTAGPASGYIWVSSSMVKPGMGGDWREHWEKYSKPVYDELLKNGTITYYAVDVEQVHTAPSGLRFVVYITPNAEGVDKVNAAFQAANQKRSAEERRAIGQALGDITVAGEHRDFFSWVSYWNK